MFGRTNLGLSVQFVDAKPDGESAHTVVVRLPELREAKTPLGSLEKRKYVSLID